MAVFILSSTLWHSLPPTKNERWPPLSVFCIPPHIFLWAYSFTDFQTPSKEPWGSTAGETVSCREEGTDTEQLALQSLPLPTAGAVVPDLFYVFDLHMQFYLKGVGD